MTSAVADDPVWAWPEQDRVTHYTMGACHHLAVALASLTGFEMGVMWNPLDWHVQPDENGQGGVLELIHIFVVDPQGYALDIRGRQTVEEMKRAMATYDWEICPHEPLSLARLTELVDDSRSLAPFDRADLDDAVEVIRRHPVLAAIVRQRDPSFAMPSEFDRPLPSI